MGCTARDSSEVKSTGCSESILSTHMATHSQLSVTLIPRDLIHPLLFQVTRQTRSTQTSTKAEHLHTLRSERGSSHWHRNQKHSRESHASGCPEGISVVEPLPGSPALPLALKVTDGPHACTCVNFNTSTPAFSSSSVQLELMSESKLLSTCIYHGQHRDGRWERRKPD